MEEEKCRGCGFSHPAHQGKLWCELAHSFAENLGDFCPKELDIGTIRRSCKCHLPSEKPVGGDDMCRAPSHEHDFYGICWIKDLDGLLRDPDFQLKGAAK